MLRLLNEITVAFSACTVLCKFPEMQSSFFFQLVNTLLKLEYFHQRNSIFHSQLFFLFPTMKPCWQQSLALIYDAAYLCTSEGRGTLHAGRWSAWSPDAFPTALCMGMVVCHWPGRTAPRSSFFHKEEQRKKIKFKLLLSFESLDGHSINTQRLKVIRWQPYKKDFFNEDSLLRGSLTLRL